MLSRSPKQGIVESIKMFAILPLTSLEPDDLVECSIFQCIYLVLNFVFSSMINGMLKCTLHYIKMLNNDNFDFSLRSQVIPGINWI